MMAKHSVIMADRQAPLAKLYDLTPAKAMITDSASAKCSSKKVLDPLHGEVTVAGHTIPVAVHSAVGGDSDAAVPGDILCAALASCLDTTIRIIANRLRLELLSVEVQVSADVDVRVTLCLDPKVPVAFQKMHLSVALTMPRSISSSLVKALFQGAERSCVVLQTLKSALKVSTQFHSNNETYLTDV